MSAPGTLLDAVAGHAARDPDRIALVHEGHPIPYVRLRDDAWRACGWLDALGIRPGEWVGLTLRDEYSLLVLSLALAGVGACQVGLPGFDPPEARQSTARRLGVGWILGDEEGDGLPETRFARVDPQAWAPFAAQAPRRPPVHATQIVSAFASSGTTGRPKLIPFTQQTLLGSAACFPSPPAVLGFLVANEHNPARMHQLRMLALGLTSVLSSSRRRQPIDAFCRAHGVTELRLFAYGAQNLLAELAAHDGERPLMPGVRIVLTGSKIPRTLIDRVRAELTPQVLVSYGATECGTIAQSPVEELEDDPALVGRPAPGFRVDILDEEDRPLPAGTAGRIRIVSPGCVDHYLDDAEATERAFGHGGFTPGDLGYLTPDGRLALLGRADDMMILTSINIFPAEIETVAESFPGVDECAAFPVHSRLHGSIPVLAVTSRDGVDLTALAAHCRQRLGNRAPRKIIRVDALPRNAAGKVVRRELTERHGRPT